MNTRRATTGSSLRQERWASARTEERGLLANLVSARLADVADRLERKLVWWIQERSWQAGGIEGLAAALLAEDPGLRKSKRLGLWETEQARRLAEILAECCLDSGSPGLGRLAELVGSLRDRAMAEGRRECVETELARRAFAVLDRCAGTRRPCLLEGPARTGKTTAARAWCAASGGRARYVATPPGNDLDSLFRAIAKAIGSASALSFKTRQVEERILRALPGSGLVLVFDSASNLWPQGDTRQSHPKRLTWLVDLIDSGVPFAMVTAPTWWETRRAFLADTGWAVEQFDGRLASVEQLPGEIGRADAEAVARHMFPEGCATSWEILGAVAVASRRRFGALESVIQEARYIAETDGRQAASLDDLKLAARGAQATDSRFALESTPRPAPSTTPAAPVPTRGSIPAAMVPGECRGPAGRGVTPAAVDLSVRLGA